jgi:lipoate-protein ligase A
MSEKRRPFDLNQEAHVSEMTGLQPDEIKRRWAKQEWQLLAPTPLSPMIHTALDETLTLRVGRGDRLPTLRIWQWSGPCVVLGRFQSVRNEVNADVLAENGFDLVRRISGGGAMFIQPEGAITYSIYAPEEMAAGMSFPESYAFFDAWVIDALRELGVEARYAPLNDITSTNGKIGGAAQARRGGAILHHATMAYQMDGDLMSKILRTGKEKLSDKGVQSADKRVAPLLQQTALDRDVIIHHLIGHFRARFGLVDGELSREELDEAGQAVVNRFGTHEWVYFLP